MASSVIAGLVVAFGVLMAWVYVADRWVLPGFLDLGEAPALVCRAAFAMAFGSGIAHRVDWCEAGGVLGAAFRDRYPWELWRREDLFPGSWLVGMVGSDVSLDSWVLAHVARGCQVVYDGREIVAVRARRESL